MKTSGLLLFLACLTSALAGVTSHEVVPRETDPEIGEEFNTPHGIYVDRQIIMERGAQAERDRHELLLFISGTHGNGEGAKAFCELAAGLGYHVINLTYPDKIAASICAEDSDPEAFEKFRLATLTGGRSKHITISRADSIENRLVKLLAYLAQKWPGEGWGRYLNPDATINWPAIAVSGHSQGGGHAALLGIKHRVARVICLGSPKDYSRRLNAPAAWYAEASATPKARFFSFNHRQDTKACTPEEMMRNLAALKLDAFGRPVDVTKAAPPYQHTRILLTSWPEVTINGPNSKGAKMAHTSVVATANADRWEKVWTYMLTEEPAADSR